MLKKSKVIDSFQNLPEDVTADELIERILFIRLIEDRIKSAEQGHTTSHEEFMRDFDAFKAKKRAERPGAAV